MIQLLKSILGLGPKANFEELIANGAQIIDVRSRGEFAGGHVKGSVNIPLDQLQTHLKKLNGHQHPIITCCASGMRSGSAKSYLKSQGFKEVHNGGSWQNLTKYMK